MTKEKPGISIIIVGPEKLSDQQIEAIKSIFAEFGKTATISQMVVKDK